MSGDWRIRAACGGTDPALWFGSDDEKILARRAREARARAVCASCVVRASCLQFAVAGQIRFGVWGGEDFEQARNRLCRNQRHLMDGPNTSVSPDGSRNCRACRQEGRERGRQRRQEEGGVAA